MGPLCVSVGAWVEWQLCEYISLDYVYHVYVHFNMLYAVAGEIHVWYLLSLPREIVCVDVSLFVYLINLLFWLDDCVVILET